MWKVTENVTYKNRCTTLSDNVCQWLAAGLWFSPVLGPVSSTNKTDRHDIDEILLKMALSAIKQTIYAFILAVIIYM
jgi:hypothetical protein